MCIISYWRMTAKLLLVPSSGSPSFPSLARAAARRSWPVRKFRLGEEPDEDLSATTTAKERLDACQCAHPRPACRSRIPGFLNTISSGRKSSGSQDPPIHCRYV